MTMTIALLLMTLFGSPEQPFECRQEATITRRPEAPLPQQPPRPIRPTIIQTPQS
jgi:hypothetical protein